MEGKGRCKKEEEAARKKMGLVVPKEQLDRLVGTSPMCGWDPQVCWETHLCYPLLTPCIRVERAVAVHGSPPLACLHLYFVLPMSGKEWQKTVNTPTLPFLLPEQSWFVHCSSVSPRLERSQLGIQMLRGRAGFLCVTTGRVCLQEHSCLQAKAEEGETWLRSCCHVCGSFTRTITLCGLWVCQSDLSGNGMVLVSLGASTGLGWKCF